MNLPSGGSRPSRGTSLIHTQPLATRRSISMQLQASKMFHQWGEVSLFLPFLFGHCVTSQYLWSHFQNCCAVTVLMSCFTRRAIYTLPSWLSICPLRVSVICMISAVFASCWFSSFFSVAAMCLFADLRVELALRRRTRRGGGLLRLRKSSYYVLCRGIICTFVCTLYP